MSGTETVDERELEVIVIDDHLTMRRGIELLLRDAGLRIAGVASTADEARVLLARRRHDVALLDVHLGDQTSLDLVKERLREDPAAPIVLYTGVTGPDSGLLDVARAGARGFVLKSSPPERLVGAIRAVAGGGSYVDPDLAGELSADADLRRVVTLTPREREVLLLLADGLNGQRIADHLMLSPETVRTHVRNATTKLGARTRIQAVAMVVRTRGVV